MRVVHLLLLLVLLGGAACQKPSATCSSADAAGVVSDIIRTELEKQIVADMQGDDGQKLVTDAKVRAALAELEIALSDTRTVKEDPDSTKRFCKANVDITAPLEVVQDAVRARELAQMPSMTDVAERMDIVQNANRFSFEADYNVQPTDDGKKVYGELENTSPLAFFAELVGAHLVKSLLESSKAQQEIDEAEQARLEAEQLQLTRQAVFEEAAAENKLVNQTLTEIWRAIPEVERARLLEVQRAWIKKKDVACGIEAAQTSTDPTERETARLRCDTRAAGERAEWFRQNFSM